MIYVYDYLIAPSILDRRSYSIIILFCYLLEIIIRHFYATQLLVIVILVFALQFVIAKKLRKRAVEKCVAVPILLALPLLTYGFYSFFAFIFVHGAW